MRDWGANGWMECIGHYEYLRFSQPVMSEPRNTKRRKPQFSEMIWINGRCVVCPFTLVVLRTRGQKGNDVPSP